MNTAARSITTLLVGSGVLFLGQGLLVTVLPIRAQLEAFTATSIGLMGAVFFAGFALGCVIGPMAVKRVGHIRCFAGFAAIAAATVLVHPLAVSPLIWSVLRGLTGICIAVLYMVVESWLNDQASNEVRGQVLSIYIIVTNLATLAGQLMANAYDPLRPALFILVAMAISVSLVPMALTDTPAPRPIASARLRIIPLYRLSPTGFVGCLAIGMIDGAFWTLAPVFAQAQTMEVSEVTFFMGAFVVGGTISQWPLGRLSDKFDRRYMIAGCSLGTVGTGLGLAFLELHSPTHTALLAGLHGAFMIPLYALLLAHANDHAAQDALVETSSGLLLLYGGGAVVGPLLIGPIMEATGPGSLFLAMAVVLGLHALFIGYRVLRRPVAAIKDRATFVPVPKTTPSLYELETDD